MNGLFQPRVLPFVLLFLCLLSYGLLIPELGFYWDDWPAIWVSHSLGPLGLRQFAASDRPFQGWLLTLTTPLLGVAPLQWHILALVTRWLSAVAIWCTLRRVWPQRTQEITSVSLLFAVYPGFTQQPIAWTYAHYAFIPLALSASSLGAMVWAVRIPRLFWPLTLWALTGSAFSMMLTEYFFGLELLRPMFLWLILGRQGTNDRTRMRATLAAWWPYLTVMGVFLIWRLLLFKSTRPATDQSIFFAEFLANPFERVVHGLFVAFSDLLQATLMAWEQTFRPNIFDYGRLGWGLVLISAIGVAVYLARLESAVDSKNPTVMAARVQWTKQAIVIGLLGVLLGQLPVWFVDRHIILEDAYDRYTLMAMLGASILLAGLIHAMLKTRLQQIAVVAILVGFAVGFHFRNGRDYHQNWLDQKSLLWQLSWRAPSLKPGTSLLMRPQRLGAADYALAAALNFVYAPEGSSPRLDYWVFRLSEETLADFHKAAGETSDSADLKRTLRSLSFSGSTSNMLVVRFAPPSCLVVLDPSREIPRLDPLERAVQHVSNLNRIEVTTLSRAHPFAPVFGPAPGHDWCYYFETAELARQMRDWRRVSQMADEARRLGLQPGNPTELLPFIDGYAHLGRYGDAKEMIRTALQAMPDMQSAIDDLVNKLGGPGSAALGHKALVAEKKANGYRQVVKRG